MRIFECICVNIDDIYDDHVRERKEKKNIFTFENIRMHTVEYRVSL